MAEPIGIVGLGDLGGKLTLQAESAGFEVLAFDPGTPKTPDAAINPAQSITGLRWLPEMAGSAQEVIEETYTVHWCAPLVELRAADVSRAGHLILHDSVMASSVHALEDAKEEAEYDGFEVGVVHCLMNPEAFVNVGDVFDSDKTAEHMESLGLNVKIKTVDDHDRFMAHSQARYAWGVLDDFNNLQQPDCDFTPSGLDYRNALKTRAGNWTLTTLRSIFGNEYIPFNERVEALKKIEQLAALGYTTVNG